MWGDEAEDTETFGEMMVLEDTSLSPSPSSPEASPTHPGGRPFSEPRRSVLRGELEGERGAWDEEASPAPSTPSPGHLRPRRGYVGAGEAGGGGARAGQGLGPRHSQGVLLATSLPPSQQRRRDSSPASSYSPQNAATVSPGTRNGVAPPPLCRRNDSAFTWGATTNVAQLRDERSDMSWEGSRRSTSSRAYDPARDPQEGFIGSRMHYGFGSTKRFWDPGGAQESRGLFYFGTQERKPSAGGRAGSSSAASEQTTILTQDGKTIRPIGGNWQGSNIGTSGMAPRYVRDSQGRECSRMISPMPRSSTAHGINQPVWPMGRNPGVGAAAAVNSSRARLLDRVPVRGSTYDGTGRERPRSAGPSNRHPGPRLSEGFGGGYSPAHASSSSFARRHRGSGNGDEDGDGDWNGDGHGDGGRNGNGDVVRRLAAESSQSRSRLSSGSSAISDRLARLSTPKVRPDPEFASPSYYNVAEAYDACYKKHKPKLTFSRARGATRLEMEEAALERGAAHQGFGWDAPPSLPPSPASGVRASVGGGKGGACTGDPYEQSVRGDGGGGTSVSSAGGSRTSVSGAGRSRMSVGNGGRDPRAPPVGREREIADSLYNADAIYNPASTDFDCNAHKPFGQKIDGRPWFYSKYSPAGLEALHAARTSERLNNMSRNSDSSGSGGHRAREVKEARGAVDAGGGSGSDAPRTRVSAMRRGSASSLHGGSSSGRVGGTGRPGSASRERRASSYMADDSWIRRGGRGMGPDPGPNSGETDASQRRDNESKDTGRMVYEQINSPVSTSTSVHEAIPGDWIDSRNRQLSGREPFCAAAAAAEVATAVTASSREGDGGGRLRPSSAPLRRGDGKGGGASRSVGASARDPGYGVARAWDPRPDARRVFRDPPAEPAAGGAGPGRNQVKPPIWTEARSSSAKVGPRDAHVSVSTTGSTTRPKPATAAYRPNAAKMVVTTSSSLSNKLVKPMGELLAEIHAGGTHVPKFYR